MSKEGIRLARNTIVDASRILRHKLEEYTRFAERVAKDNIISDEELNNFKNSLIGWEMDTDRLDVGLGQLLSYIERT
mgnify:CR=1 FL=1|tara:strand:+ start:105 stop:335 length:231 start_codon:yes stop_codon:yes gene_type:complete